MAKVKEVPQIERLEKPAVGLDPFTMRSFIEGLLYNMQGGVFIVDRQKRITLFYKAAEKITGYSASEVVGRVCQEVFRSPLCEQRCCFKEILKKRTSVCDIELQFHCKASKPIPVNITAFPLKDHEAKIVGMVEIFRDISGLKNLQNQLIHTDKLTMMGQIAAGVAHEINNPINGILTYIKLLLRKLEKGDLPSVVEDFKKYLLIMEKETKRVGRTTKNLLDFSRRAEPDIRPIHINEVIEHSLVLLNDQLKIGNVEVRRELKPALPEVMGDFGQLQQVFMNLIMNAIQAMPKGGRLEIKTALEGEPGREGFVRIDVSDTGCGIPEEDIPKVFDPFFTTKCKRGDTCLGLGLSIVQGIIKDHRGQIYIKSEVGKGTTFTIKIPTV